MAQCRFLINQTHPGRESVSLAGLSDRRASVNKVRHNHDDRDRDCHHNNDSTVLHVLTLRHGLPKTGSDARAGAK